MSAPGAGEPAAEYLVIGTAGHIDHGKTSLVHRLTGVFLDTLPEEQERGITIALGFTHLRLPGGREAAFVDVPGHERLVRTMVAGASGIDVALLCVSAVEGVMPQTREHLAILGLLGVRHGVVALTFADLVDEEMLLLAEEDVRDALRASSLEGAAIVPFSSVTGQGRDALVAALDALPAGSRDVAGPFRLPVDRVFTQHGHGTVVTGTVRSGRLQEGQEIEILPEGTRVRVRSLQVHGASVPTTRAGLRTAVNLPIPKDALARGAELCEPGAVPAARVVDVTFTHLPGAPAFDDGAQVRFLVGTAEGVATARLLGEARIPPEDHPAGEPWHGLLQLLLADPTPCRPGDRYVLRRASPVDTLGGGEVLDPWGRPARHRERAEVREVLARMAAGERHLVLHRAGPGGLSQAEARQRACLPGAACPQAVALGDRVVHLDHVRDLEGTVLEELRAFHAANPLVEGALRKEIHHGLLRALEDRALDALLGRMLQARTVAEGAGRYRRADFSVRVSQEQEAAGRKVEEAAAKAGIAALSADELAAVTGRADGEKLVFRLAEKGVLVKVGPFLVLRPVLDAFVADVRRWLAETGSLTPAEVRDRSGLTRKHLIPYLEWLDAQRITRRAGDKRVPFK